MSYLSNSFESRPNFHILKMLPQVIVLKSVKTFLKLVLILIITIISYKLGFTLTVLFVSKIVTIKFLKK